MLRFLSAADVVKVLPMAEAIEGMKSAYAQLSAGKADLPLRSRVGAKANGVMLTMPAYMQDSNELSVKIVSVFPENAARNLPIIHAMVMAFDPDTGQPIALIEGGTLTAIRTGAGAGAATDLLARPDSSVVTIIGSGVQARTQLEAVCTVRNIETAYVYSPNRDHALTFAEEMAGRGSIPAEINVVDDVNAAVSQSDIVCAATTSTTPVMDGNALKLGTHINGVGSYRPDMQEFDEETLQKALITVDSRDAVLEEAGEIIIALRNGTITQDDIYAEIGEIAAGSKPGRTDDAQITYFKSVGVGVQDAVAAGIAARNAEAHDLGTVLDLGG